VLEGLYAAGKVRAIGVSNYTIPHLQQLLDVAQVRPMVNQVCVCVFVRWCVLPCAMAPLW
jgi:diketogulonate reductase-like aldo/keto reductase